MDVVALVSSFFKRNKKGREAKVLAILLYIFYGSCRKISKILSFSLEPISKSTIDSLARIIVASKPG